MNLTPADRANRDSNLAVDTHFAPFLGTIIETIGIGLWDWNLQTGHVVYSKQWEALAGYEEGEVPQTVTSWENCVLPQDLPASTAAIDRYLQGETPLYESEFRLKRKDGSIIWAQDRGIISEWDENGKPLRMIGVLQDVSRIKEAEQALTEKTEHLDFVAKICGLGMWEWDLTTDIISYNNDYLEMLGYQNDEITGSFEEWERFNHPTDIVAVNKALDDYIAGKTDEYVIETRMRHKDGHYVWTLDTGRIVEWDENGKPRRLIGGHLNIDKLKRAELAAQASLAENARYSERLQEEIQDAVSSLQQTERFSKTMFEASPYISLICDDKLQMMDCNPVAVDFFGFENREQLLQNLLPLIDRSIPKRQPDGSLSIPLAERFAAVLETGSLAFETELILRGQSVPMRVIFKKVPYKNTFAIAVYMIDLTSLREARGELLQQDRLLRVVNGVSNDLMSASPENFDAVVWQSLGNFAKAVHAGHVSIWRNVEMSGQMYCQQIYEWAKGETAYSGKQPGEASTRAAYSQLQSLYQTLKQGNCINTLTPRDEGAQQEGGPAVTSTLLLPILMQDTFWGFIGFDDCHNDRIFTETEIKVLESGGLIFVSAISRNDLTENLILAREDALASTRAKSDFLSRMSHEIRTPMNAIIGMNTIAKKTRDYNKIQYCLEKIDSASQQLLEIINDILDMSKIESGKLEMTQSEFDFERMVQNVFDVIHPQVEQNNQKFTMEFGSLFERLMICDELRLSQVITNLLSNAVKFTGPGGEVQLRVSHHTGESGLPVLHVEVQDTGIGISPEQQEKLFQSFEQGDGGITRRYGGTGLGLAICKRILGMMGGDISVQSEVGKGSTFSFEIPFAWGEELKTTVASKHLPKDLRILVVDDSEDVHMYFSALLTGFSLSCDVAGSGQEAVKMVRKAQEDGRPYKLVFMDWMMPLMGGTDAAREVRGIAGDDTIIVMISAADWSDIEKEVSSFGVKEYLSKPVLPSILFNTILRLTGDTLVSEPTETAAAEYNWRDKNILLVEDLPINQEIIYGILDGTGVAIDTAENGRLGVNMFLAAPEKYDLILMDMQMPEMDGLEATRFIRKSEVTRAADIPILAMTANAFTEDVENCLAAGMNGHIAKPIDVDALMSCLEKYLQ